jgi:hypothetical protein
LYNTLVAGIHTRVRIVIFALLFAQIGPEIYPVHDDCVPITTRLNVNSGRNRQVPCNSAPYCCLICEVGRIYFFKLFYMYKFLDRLRMVVLFDRVFPFCSQLSTLVLIREYMYLSDN